MPRPRLQTILLGLTLLLPLGCKPTGTPPLDAAGAADKVGTHLDSADTALQAKLQPLIHCINRTFHHFDDIAPAYRDRIQDLQHPRAANSPNPSFSTTFVSFKVEPYEQNGAFSNECATGLDKAAAMPPADPAIDNPAKDAAAALRALLQPGRQMDAYLAQKTYLNDGFSGGRALDAAISPLLNRLVADSSRLRDQVQIRDATLQQHQLDAIDRAEGHSLRWHTKQSMVAARALNDNVVHLADTRRLNAAAVAAAAAPLQAALTDTANYVAAHPNSSQPNGRNGQPMWFSVNSLLSNELGAANELHNTLQSPAPDPDNVNAQLQTLTSDFNGVIRTYNTMQQNHITSDF